MHKRLLGLVAGVMFGAAVAQAGEAPVLLAQGKSCKGWFDTCAARCKTRNPTDKMCVADHCSPKLADCRKDGCWQEGGLYGGQRHCGLSK
jgi:hypothetical protein